MVSYWCVLQFLIYLQALSILYELYLTKVPTSGLELFSQVQLVAFVLFWLFRTWALWHQEGSWYCRLGVAGLNPYLCWCFSLLAGHSDPPTVRMRRAKSSMELEWVGFSKFNSLGLVQARWYNIGFEPGVGDVLTMKIFRLFSAASVKKTKLSMPSLSRAFLWQSRLEVWCCFAAKQVKGLPAVK